MTGHAEPARASARRERTRRQLVDILRQHTTLTRADLSRLSGLSASAISDSVASLVSDGLVVEAATADHAAAGRGRRAVLLSLSRPSGIVVGIDLGHAHIAAAVATTAGEVLVECRDELDVDHRPGQALDLAAALARQALEQSGHAIGDVHGIAAGIPGPLDVRTEVVRAPTILSDWIGLAPAAELSDRLGHPVVIGNDADMGARGERAYGAARGLNDFLYIKASHGIGAGIVLGGNTYCGATGIAGEIGHTHLAGATSWCRCGNRGCLETVVSITAVRQQLAHVLPNHSAADERAVPPLAELARDAAASRVITDAGRTVGRVLADLVNCLNPAALVLGGELSTAGEPFAAGVRESVQRYAQPASAQAADVVLGGLGLRAELLGAVATAVHASGAADL
jgi:predicted NBD/HSP70 family sugar kinase